MSLLARLNRTVGAAPTGTARSLSSPEAPTAAEVLPSADALPSAEAEMPASSSTGPTEPSPLSLAATPLADSLARHGATLARRLSPDTPLPALPPASLGVALPSLRTLATELGPVSVIPTFHAPDHRHGAHLLAPRSTPSTAGDVDLARLLGDPRLAGFDPRRAIYLDIETTGLEHGAGNVAFLIALGWFEADSFQLQQLLLQEPCEEAAMLGQLWEWVAARPWLVSFNGKSFDLTILQGRLKMHRLCSAEQAALKLRPHLDLLHACRAFFAGRWPDTRLQTLERELLGLAREDDMPGSEAPRCYFRFLRTGDAAPLGAIARHNADDVLSMVALARLLADLASAMPEAPLELPVALNLARRALRQKDPSLTAALLAPHLATASEGPEAAETIALATRAEGRLRRAQRPPRVVSAPSTARADSGMEALATHAVHEERPR